MGKYRIYKPIVLLTVLLIAGSRVFAQKNYFFTPTQELTILSSADSNNIALFFSPQIKQVTKQITVEHENQGLQFLATLVYSNLRFSAQHTNDSLFFDSLYTEFDKRYSNENKRDSILFPKGSKAYREQLSKWGDLYKQQMMRFRDSMYQEYIFKIMVKDSFIINGTAINNYYFYTIVPHILTPPYTLSKGGLTDIVATSNLRSDPEDDLIISANLFTIFDTAFYTYSNTHKMIARFRIAPNDYQLNENHSFKWLNFNGLHCEWLYNQTGQPVAMMKINLIEKDNIRKGIIYYFKYGRKQRISDVTEQTFGYTGNDWHRSFFDNYFTVPVRLPDSLFEQQKRLDRLLFARTSADFKWLHLYNAGHKLHVEYNAQKKVTALSFPHRSQWITGKYISGKNGLVKEIIYTPINKHTIKARYYYTYSKQGK
jgi:hypothetical protein